MKKRYFLGIAFAILSMVITSCSNLLPNMSRNRRGSSNIDEQSSVDYDNTSSQHRHNWSGWYVVKEATCQEGGIRQRECTVCGVTEQSYTHARGHSWDDYEIVYPATCTQDGLGRVYCVVCGMMQEETIPAYGHQWGDWEYTVEPTCTLPGYGKRTCVACHEVEETETPAYGHDVQLVDYQNPEEGMSPTRLYRCNRCDLTYLGFNVNDVTAESKEHLVFKPETPYYGEEQGACFFGRPIGNAMALSADGVSINQMNDECVYCSTERGDFFEFAFNLTEEQAVELATCRLYCDAKPADYLNGTDFWAYGRSNDDWTPGYYIDGTDNHIEKDDLGNPIMVKDHAKSVVEGESGQELDIEVPLGKRIEGYRYALYVDDQIVDFDPDIENPTHGSNTNMQREEFVLPYTFHLHQGLNKISIHMAGGYRSTFYNFTFRPINNEEDWIIDNTMPAPKEGEALVKRYNNAFDHRVKYVVDVATANMSLAEGSSWKTNPETGFFKLSRNENSCSFTFSINQAFEGKAYQVGYMDSYSANMQRPLYYQNTDQPNIEFKVNDVVTDLSKFKETKFQDVFGTEVNGANSYVKEVEIGDVFLKKSNTVVFKRLYSYNLTISQFVFIGEEHDNHDFTVNEKLPDSPLRPMTCPKCGATGYELELLDSNAAISPIKLKQDVIWNVTGIEPGTYEVHLSACARNTTLKQDIVSGGIGRYSFRFGSTDYISPASGTYESYGFGEGEALEYCKWTQTLCTIDANNLTSEFSIHYGGQGYSSFISGVRLVKVA